MDGLGNPNHRWTRDGYELTTDPDSAQLDAIHGYLTRSYWSPGNSREAVERGLRGSMGFHLLWEGAQVGLARVISDFASFGYLADVYVLEEHQGRGLGGWMLECIDSVPELRGLRHWTLLTNDAQGFYARYGWSVAQEPGRVMQRFAPKE